MEEPVPIDGSLAGRAFLGDDLVEQAVEGGVRVYLPLLDGTDRVGVLAFTSDNWDEHDRRLARRFAGLLADVVVTKGRDTDRFFQAGGELFGEARLVDLIEEVSMEGGPVQETVRRLSHALKRAEERSPMTTVARVD